VAMLIPPRLNITATAAMADENFEGDVAVIMGCSASKSIRPSRPGT
jgi:hypothetical protein